MRALRCSVLGGCLWWVRPAASRRRDQVGGCRFWVIWVEGDRPATSVLRKRLHHADRRVHLAQPLLVAEVDRMVARTSTDPDYPLRVITVRELRSHNTWTQNVPKLMAGGRSQRLRIHPLDAQPLAISRQARTISVRLPVDRSGSRSRRRGPPDDRTRPGARVRWVAPSSSRSGRNAASALPHRLADQRGTDATQVRQTIRGCGNLP
jgi:hypothetical protein